MPNLSNGSSAPRLQRSGRHPKTIEAIKQVIRDFGLAALEQPSTKDRVLQCDADARNRLDNWISDFKKRNSG
jgi:hypothetical protein